MTIFVSFFDCILIYISYILDNFIIYNSGIIINRNEFQRCIYIRKGKGEKMKLVKKSFAILITVATIISSIMLICPVPASNAASVKLQYISFKNDKTGKYNKVIKNGNYYLRVKNCKIQVKKVNGGTYKTTSINTDYKSGLASSGNYLYFIDNSKISPVMKRYNCSTGKINKVANLPEKSKKNKKYTINAVDDNNIYFGNYTLNLKSKKVQEINSEDIIDLSNEEDATDIYNEKTKKVINLNK